MRGTNSKTIGLAILCLGFMASAILSQAAITPPINRSTTQWRYNSTNVDPGPTWRDAAFDDSTWSTGFGLFGADGGYDTPFLTPLPGSGATTIHYFRNRFTWTGATAGAILTGRLYVDDGCVIHINGVEVFRENVADNPVVHTTLAVAANPRGEPVQFNFEVNLATNVSNPLIVGENIIAVTLHQNNNTSSDQVFGLDLDGGAPAAPTIDDPAQPANAAVRQGRSHTLTVVASGVPAPTYQWFKDTFPITGATASTYTIANMTAADAGNYYCEVNNPSGTAVSRTAVITYTVDNTGPIALSGRLDSTGTNVTVTFNEPMDPLFFDAFGIYVDPTGEGPGGENTLGVALGVLVNNTNWVFSTTTPATPGTSYNIYIFTGAVTDQFGNITEQDFDITLDSEITFFGFDGAWSFYWQSSVDASNWKDAAFDDSTWGNGPGLLGTEPNLAAGNATVPGHHIRTPFPSAGTGAANMPTTYLRKKFIVPVDPATLSGVVLNYIFDDGCVVFLNGTEIIRRGVAVNETYTTFGSSHEADVVDSFTITSGLVQGENILAVRVHDTDAASSSDRVWGARLRGFGNASVTPPTITDPLPASQTVAEGASVTYSVAAGGIPVPTIQWYKNGSPIAGATGNSITFNPALDSDSGVYHAVASNGNPPDAVSATATLTVQADVMGPVLVSGQVRDNGSVALGFDEDVNPLVLNTGSISVYPTGGDPVSGNLGVASGAVEGGSTWVLTLSTAPTLGVNYSVRLLAGAVADPFGNGNLETTRNLRLNVTVFPYDGSWSWIDTDQDAQAWTTLGFDDSLWGSGPGLLGTEPNLGPGNTTVPGHEIRTPFPSGSAGAPGLTTYLRKKFTLPAALSEVQSVTMNYLFDDGIVVFLNGAVIIRTGVVTNETYATTGTSHEADTIDTFSIPLNLLVDGENILAVRVHDQATTSSDRVWGAELKATVNSIVVEAPTVTDPLPASQTVAEGATVSYSVSVTGFPFPTIQWNLNGSPISGANGLSYTIASAGAADQGTYTVTASNSAGSDTSAGAVLNVTIDTISPTLVQACAVLDINSIVLEFSEGMLEDNATNVANYAVALRGGGGDLTINSATLSSGNTVVTLDVSGRLANQNYRITITGLTDDAGARNLLNPNPTIANVWSEVVVLDANASTSWTYNDQNTDLGTTWKNPGFDTTGWSTGAPLFLAKRGTLPNTDIPILTTLNLSNAVGTAQIPTAYFRSTFNFTPAATDAFLLRYIIDDGAVFYLNGTEIHRVGIDPALNPVLFTSLANRTQGNDQLFEDSVDVSAAAVAAGLVQGNNLLAVEVHQQSLTSSDLAMAVQVLTKVETVSAAPVIIAIRVVGGQVQIDFSGDNVYLKASSTLSPNTSAYTTIAGPQSSGTFNAGAATGQRYFILGDTP